MEMKGTEMKGTEMKGTEMKGMEVKKKECRAFDLRLDNILACRGDWYFCGEIFKDCIGYDVDFYVKKVTRYFNDNYSFWSTYFYDHDKITDFELVYRVLGIIFPYVDGFDFLAWLFDGSCIAEDADESEKLWMYKNYILFLTKSIIKEWLVNWSKRFIIE